MKDFKKSLFITLGFWAGTAIALYVSNMFKRVVETEVAGQDTKEDEEIFEDEKN